MVAGNNACSQVWVICGGFNTIGFFYGPIGIALLLCLCSGGEEVSQNMGDQEAFRGVTTSQFDIVNVHVLSAGHIWQSHCHVVACMYVLVEGQQGGEGQNVRRGVKVLQLIMVIGSHG